jgi:fatty-acyl-CoA synthase
MRMIDGEMQGFTLTLDKFLRHAAKWHPEAEVVTAHAEGRSERIGYAGLMARSRKVSAVLAGLGVGKGDRVATLAWNSHRHLELYWAVPLMGAVLHTLNFRLAPSALRPGRTSFAPTAGTAKGRPQALAWNIGTTASTQSA